jgi:hypothetical protein
METKNALYAAVGAPIAAVKAMNARLETIRKEMESRTDEFSGLAEKMLEDWTKEGRQVVDKVSDAKVVDELTSKVDFDQAREQVTKLRDQLEEMLATWRTSFRPVEEAAMSTARSAASAVETAGDKVEAATDEVDKTVRARTAARTTTRSSKSTTAKKASTAKKPAAKKTTKSTTSKPASKSTAKKAS